MRRPSPSQEPAGEAQADAAENNSARGGDWSNLEDFDCPYVELRIALWSANDEGWLEEMKELKWRREIIGIGAKYRTLRAKREIRNKFKTRMFK